MIKILKKLSWLLLYLLFNTVLFFIEVSILFDTNNSSNSGISGFDSIDALLEGFNAFFDVLQGMALLFFFYASIASAIFALLLFIPVQLYFINRKFKNHSRKFLYSLLASFALVILLKLPKYIFMFIEMTYS
ncbi:hypothetical protein SAMN04488007_2736 [Maribacter aquivivus]|uniref:Uncharacterized protein n=1 Tax=Maribacter aquivivus TaxID=228958 RepID=A0A1M6RHN6_9FLAO|nr:hypothetical protein SAMN04488007_2736 [Maribacter aquivivus]